MKLGGKSRDVESFVDQLKSEGENVISSVANNVEQSGHKAPAIKQDIDGYGYSPIVFYFYVFLLIFTGYISV